LKFAITLNELYSPIIYNTTNFQSIYDFKIVNAVGDIRLTAAGDPPTIPPLYKAAFLSGSVSP